MKWDAGALSENRNKSPIFRFLSNNPTACQYWPKGYLHEFGIFLNTPGITGGWVVKNFGLKQRRVERLKAATKHLAEFGVENLISATHDDAVFYMNNRPPSSPTPPWVVPFVLEDIKDEKSWKKTAEKWCISQDTIMTMKNGRRTNVFYSFNEP